MTPKPVELAKVVVRRIKGDWGTDLVIGRFTIQYDCGDRGKKLADGINRALSPLLARSALLDRAVEALRPFAEMVDGTPCDCGPGCKFCLANDILTSYASLPKMPEETNP